MNQFKDELQRARARQKRTAIFAFLAILIVAACLYALLVLIRGISVEVFPEEARAQARVEVVAGTGFALRKKVYALYGGVVIGVTAPGFSPEEVNVPENRSTRFIEVVLKEQPGILNVAAEPQHPDTRWYLDKELIAVAPELSTPLDAGAYTLDVDNPYYRKQTLDIEIGREEERHFEIRLQPIDGRIAINSSPAAATIRINGEERGTTPATLNLPGGRYTIAVTRPGYKEIRDTVGIVNTETTIAREYTLLPQNATVHFKVQPPGGELLLDGRRLKDHGRINISSLSEHTATYMKEGYTPMVRRFRVQPGEEADIEMFLDADLGTVEINANPPATVFIDGKRIGETPLSATLSAVPHNVVIAREGYRPVTRKITPAGGETKRISVHLKAELQARLEESPGTYENSIGMTMQLFRPGALEMGAPRGERGRRANEFRRQVMLSKRFYAALHEVTVDQFNFYKGTPGTASNHPVASVGWLDAARFCNWLSARENLRPFYQFNGGNGASADVHADGYRLPTEAEWEWLARNAGRDAQTRFPWGDSNTVPPSGGNLADESAKAKVRFYIPDYNDGFVGPAPVGSFPADLAGLHDLSGNLSEWTHDLYSLEPPQPGVATDPMGPAHGDSHVIKGSNWRSGTITELRASFRDGAKSARDDLGFRVVRYLYGEEDVVR